MPSSNIIYQGKVTVKVKGKPPVKLKNNGTQSFFTALYNILSLTVLTNNPDKFRSVLPCEMSIVMLGSDHVWVDDNYSSVSSESLLTTPMSIVSRNVATVKNHTSLSTSVTFDCLLTHGYINATKYDSTKTGFILLLDGQAEQKILAYTEFDLQQIADVASTANSQATISWQLSFGNGGK